MGGTALSSLGAARREYQDWKRLFLGVCLVGYSPAALPPVLRSVPPLARLSVSSGIYSSNDRCGAELWTRSQPTPERAAKRPAKIAIPD
jgi:hypothetical protein